VPAGAPVLVAATWFWGPLACGQSCAAPGCACGPCVAASAGVGWWGGRRSGGKAVRVGVSKQHGAAGEGRRAVPEQTVLQGRDSARTRGLLLLCVFNSLSCKCAVTPGFRILSSEERLAPL